MENKELYLRIGELYSQLHRLGDMYKELERKNIDLQQELALIKNGQSKQGNIDS